MRKTKPPRRSRLIRKWDGTPVNETDSSGRPIPPDASELSPGTLQSKTDVKELHCDVERDEELMDTIER